MAELAKKAAMQALYDNNQPVLRMLSSLAEGADRIAAECALAEGYILQCPLPFEQEIYVKDFADPASQNEFNTLLMRADRVLQMDGEQNKKYCAYQQVRHFLLHHADIMLAVWDGKIDETSLVIAELVAETQQRGLPQLWINAAEPHAIKYWDRQVEEDNWSDFEGKWLYALLESLLLPHREEQPHEFGVLKKWRSKISRNTWSVYETHPEPRRNLLGTAYLAFFALGDKHSLSFIGKPYRQHAESQWAVIADAAKHLPVGSGVVDTLEEQIRMRYVRADSLASYYADHYRGTFILSFFLGDWAVLFAVLGAPLAGLPAFFELFSILELLTISIIIASIIYGSIRQTHQCWLDFRLLAERLRQQAFMLPIGATSRWTLPGYEGHDDHSHAWIDGFMRAVSRAEGIPHACFDAQYRRNYSRYLTDVLKNQVDYHHRNAGHNENIVEVLETGSRLFLLLVIVACVAHILDHWLWHSRTLALWSTVFATALPAFGAAFAGILSQDEFERIAHRSEGMAKKLQAIVNQLDKRSPSLSAEELKKLVNDASDIISSELSDWRVIFRSKTLKMEP